MNILLAEISDDEVGLIASFIILAIVTAAMYSFRVNIAEPTEKELLTLHRKRMALIRAALASSAESGWDIPPSPFQYPFESWIKLVSQGVSVGGEIWSPDKKFEIVARDDRNIPRAAVACDGRGALVIQSHGQTFRALFEAGSWSVQQIQNPA